MKSLKFSCPDDLREQIEEQAHREESSVSQVIRRALRSSFRDDAREAEETKQ